MAINAGDAACSTGLSGSIFAYWLFDPDNGFSPQLTTEQLRLLKAQCYQWARAIAAAHNADASGSAVNVVDGETPAGTVNGANAAFTLAHAPNPASSLHLFLNGIRLWPGTDYTLSGATITYAGGMIPQTGDTHGADYRY
jgi:hypothetical protein